MHLVQHCDSCTDYACLIDHKTRLATSLMPSPARWNGSTTRWMTRRHEQASGRGAGLPCGTLFVLLVGLLILAGVAFLLRGPASARRRGAHAHSHAYGDR